jgi:hypothetical protein
MAILGVGSGTGFPGAIDTAQTFANIGSPDPDDNTRVDAELVNDVLAAILAIENNCARLGVANTFTANQIISNAAPALTLQDTTGGAQSLYMYVDANLAHMRALAGAYGSLWVFDLANNRASLGTASPSGAALLNLNPVPSANWTLSGANPSSLVTIANDGTYDLAVGGGLVILHPDNLDYAPMLFMTGGGSVALVSDAGGFGSTTMDTAGKINVYYNAGKYRIQNKRGSSRDIYIVTIMSRAAS